MHPELPVLIQGGMGVGVSGWRLARAVSRLGHLGVVSGIGANTLLVRRLQDGDAGGHVRRALGRFPDAGFAREVLARWFLPAGRAPGQPYRLSPLPALQPDRYVQRLIAAGAFCEVFLAKEGHGGRVGINVLEKLVLTNLPALYGAMLAGVDHVLVGAGIPREIPGALDRLARREEAALRVPVAGAVGDEPLLTRFDPAAVLGAAAPAALARPAFLAIVSSATLAQHLLRSSNGRVDGFIVEGSSAGGHNAPPRGPLRLDARGEPVYGPKDELDVAALRALGVPFWLAGSFGAPGKLREARALGAAGIQVGTLFAFCEESGLAEPLRRTVLRRWGAPQDEPLRVITDPCASPTQFPFKVVPLAGTLSDAAVYAARPRRCDLGYLRQVALGPDGRLVQRCPGEPLDDFLRKGGAAADTPGRKCLCNALFANIDLGQVQPGGFVEPPLVTAGDDLAALARCLPAGSETYGAAAVVAHLVD
jgi:NAD(P)H-dependent flavin oxidoreductase YrpB (nitropropane dioxygenase family)